ncbi:MAG: diguanylate cyclase [Rhodoferax sp.]|nr:diguanylate cyclase [Rhodoferax sp.]
MLDNVPSIANLPVSPPSRPKLLVVDDQPINIQILYQVFSATCQVFMATGGEQALQVCQDKQPDLILLDVVMPEMDGYEVCRRLKADAATAHIPVIFVTAHNDPVQETLGLDVGAVDFIAKPVNPKVVQARVKTQLTLKFQADLLRQLVYLDGLTGVYNRRFFDQQLSNEWARSVRTGTPLSMILLDVDFFKRFNDFYGHQAGDDCLRQVAATLKSNLRRPADLVARYGGEEFACILPETGFDDALELANHLGKHIQALHMDHARSDAATVVSVSLGVAAREGGTGGSAGELLGLADTQLYRAKSTGRARACGERLGERLG